jgi:hypothetical protein
MKETNYYIIKIPFNIPQKELNELREKYRPCYMMNFDKSQKEVEVEEITKEEFLSYISED